MAAIQFNFNGAEIPCELDKIERADLYGKTRTEAFDSEGKRCRLATLASDGRTLIDSGGTALASITADGNWADKGSLKPIDTERKEVAPVPSSLKAPIELLDRVAVDDYLAHLITTTYRLHANFPEALLAELKSGVIFAFPFSYRGGLSADRAFLLAGADGTIWMASGKPAQFHFIGLEQVVQPEEQDAGDGEGDDDSMDFGMM
jgi:hypothetical protein